MAQRDLPRSCKSTISLHRSWLSSLDFLIVLNIGQSCHTNAMYVHILACMYTFVPVWIKSIINSYLCNQFLLSKVMLWNRSTVEKEQLKLIKIIKTPKLSVIFWPQLYIHFGQ